MSLQEGHKFDKACGPFSCLVFTCLFTMCTTAQCPFHYNKSSFKVEVKTNKIATRLKNMLTKAYVIHALF